MWKHYRRDLGRAVQTSAGRDKGLLVANYEAERFVYGSTALTRSMLSDSVKDIGPPGEIRRFNAVLEAEERLSAYLSNIQTLYLRLRERIAFLQGTFFLLKQYQFVENLLNDISWGVGKRAAALRQRILSNSHRLLLGDITLDEEDGYGVSVRVSDVGKDVAFKTIGAIRDQALQLKTKIAVARDFMEEGAIHLKAYEAYFDGIEGELHELIGSTQGLLYHVNSDSWEEMREILAQHEDDFLQLIEALPDYDALVIDEDTYDTEADVLIGDVD